MILKAKPIVGGKIYVVQKANRVEVYTKKEMIENEHRTWWNKVKQWLRTHY